MSKYSTSYDLMLLYWTSSCARRSSNANGTLIPSSR